MGVPEIPPALDRLKPDGKVPLSTYHIGVPKLDEASVVSVKLYAVPRMPGFSASVVIEKSVGIVPGITLIVKLFVTICVPTNSPTVNV